MNNRYEERLGTDNMLPLVFRMALPAVAAQFVNLLYNIVDRIYIGHIPGIGTEALAGVGVTTSIVILISSFSSIVGAGGAPLAAMALGQGDRERAGRILGNGFVMLILFTIITSLIAYIFMEPILLLTGASERTLPFAEDYLSVYLLGTLFVEISTGLNTFISSQGRPAIAMWSVVIGALLNIILDPIFIFILDMGVKGAAIATVLSQAVSAIWVLSFLTSSSMQSAMQFASVPLVGFAQGFIPVVSYNYGHANKDRVKQCFRIVVTFMFGFNFLLILFMILCPHLVASVFTEDEVLIETVSHVMPLFLAGMSIFGLQRACQNMFVALGQAKISIFIALLRKVILLVPLALILPHFWGVEGIFAAEAISDATAAVCCTALFAWQFPKILSRIKG